MNIDIAGKLFPNITTVIIQLCSTGIMLFFFKKFLWTPMQAYFEKRAIEAEKQQAKEEMKEEMVGIAIEVAAKVLSKEMNTKENQQMVEDFVEKVVN